jgi:hypothetical protein
MDCGDESGDAVPTKSAVSSDSPTGMTSSSPFPCAHLHHACLILPARHSHSRDTLGPFLVTSYRPQCRPTPSGPAPSTLARPARLARRSATRASRHVATVYCRSRLSGTVSNNTYTSHRKDLECRYVPLRPRRVYATPDTSDLSHTATYREGIGADTVYDQTLSDPARAQVAASRHTVYRPRFESL